MTYYIMEIEGELYARWPIKTEDRIGEGMMKLPKGKPFQGVPWDKLKHGMVVEEKK